MTNRGPDYRERLDWKLSQLPTPTDDDRSGAARLVRKLCEDWEVILEALGLQPPTTPKAGPA